MSNQPSRRPENEEKDEAISPLLQLFFGIYGRIRYAVFSSILSGVVFAFTSRLGFGAGIVAMLIVLGSLIAIYCIIASSINEKREKHSKEQNDKLLRTLLLIQSRKTQEEKYSGKLYQSFLAEGLKKAEEPQEYSRYAHLTTLELAIQYFPQKKEKGLLFEAVRRLMLTGLNRTAAVTVFYRHCEDIKGVSEKREVMNGQQPLFDAEKVTYLYSDEHYCQQRYFLLGELALLNEEAQRRLNSGEADHLPKPVVKELKRFAATDKKSFYEKLTAAWEAWYALPDSVLRRHVDKEVQLISWRREGGRLEDHPYYQ